MSETSRMKVECPHCSNRFVAEIESGMDETRTCYNCRTPFPVETNETIVEIDPED